MLLILSIQRRPLGYCQRTVFRKLTQSLLNQNNFTSQEINSLSFWWATVLIFLLSQLYYYQTKFIIYNVNIIISIWFPIMKNHLTNYLLIFFIIQLSIALWTPSHFKNQALPQSEFYPSAGYCRVQTVCRTPKMDQYKYNGEIRSGYLSVDGRNGSSIAFMFFGKINATVAQLRNFPTVIVLGGGPGGSSMINNLREVGPLLLKKIFSITIQDNKYTWARDSNLLFVDQPIGTGVSCLTPNTTIPTNSVDIALDFYRAFNQLFTQSGCFNSKYLNIPINTPLYIVGQGYGAKFATAIGAKFLAEKQKGGPITGLRGVAVGGGFNNPMKILMEMGNYAFSIGLLDFQERVRMQKIALRAHFNWQNKEWAKLKTDFENSLAYMYERTGVGYYDITKDGFDEDLVQYFFSDKTNLDKFGFETSITFQSLSKQVYAAITADFMQSEVPNIEYLLASGIAVLIYQGQDDAYTSPTGTLRWLEEINYPNTVAFNDKQLIPWVANGVMFGTYKSAGKLSFVLMHNAGHYTAKDSPEGMYYLLRDWTRNNL